VVTDGSNIRPDATQGLVVNATQDGRGKGRQSRLLPYVLSPSPLGASRSHFGN
jgi:hypothetical protein